MGKGNNKTATEKADKTESQGSEAGITGTIKGFITEVEDTSASLASDMKQHFDDLTMRVSEVVSSAAETTVSMAEKVTVRDPADLLRGLLEEIKHASEVSAEVIKGRFDDLAKKAEKETEEAPKSKSKKKAAKKGTRKKKPIQKAKKKVAKKKKVAAKKASAKKTASKKRPAMKKSPSKRPAGRKKAAAKKTASKKTASKKKSISKKRGATRKKTAAKR
jgi:flagellar hook-basal body complex protein FliE